MSIKIFTSETFTHASEKLLDEVKLNMRDLKYKNIILVPQDFSVLMDVLIMAYLRKGATINVETMPFNRLMSIFQTNRNQKIISDATATILMYRAIKDVEKQIKFLKMGKSSFAKEMYEAIQHLRANGMSMKELTKKIDLIKEKKVRAKMQDIKTIFNSYAKTKQSLYSDYIDAETSFLMGLKKSELDFSNYNFYMTDIRGLTSQQLEIVGHLMKSAHSFSFALLDSKHSNQRIYPKAFLNKIKALAKESEQEFAIEHVAVKYSPCRKTIKERLFSYIPYKKCVDDKDFDVNLNQYYTCEDEIEDTLQKIRSDVINQNLRYKNISIAIPYNENYKTYLEYALKKYQIPYFLDKKELLVSQPPFRFLISALTCVQKGYLKKDFLEYIKQGYFDIDHNSKCEFENFLYKYKIDYLSTYHKKVENIKEEENIEKFNKIYKQAFESLQCIRKSGTVAEIIESINIFLYKEIDVKEKEEKYDKYLSIEKKEFIRQSIKEIKLILKELKDVFGNTKMTLKEVILLLKNIANSVNLSNIPVNIDSVYVGNITDTRFSECKKLYILGASRDNLAFMPTNKTILTKREEEILLKNNIINDKITDGELHALMLNLLLLSLKPSLSLSISCALYNNGEEDAPSSFMTEYSKMFAKEITKNKMADSYSKENIATFSNLKEILYREKDNASKTENFKKLEKLLKQKDKNFSFQTLEEPKDKINEKAAVKLYQRGENSYVFSASALEKYFSCPLNFFLERGLRIDKKPIIEMAKRDFGTLVHEVLEKFFRENKDLDISDKKIEQKVKKIFKDIINANTGFSFLIQDNKYKGEFERNQKQCIYTVKKVLNTIKKTGYKPTEFELAFVEEGDVKPLALKVQDSQVTIEGKIDRIDEKDGNILIVDYKTGNVDFKEEKISLGEYIQVFVYADAYRQSTNKDVKGVLYLSVKNKYDTREKRETKEDEYYDYQGIIDKNDSVANTEPMGKTVQVEKEILEKRIQEVKDIAKVGIQGIQSGNIEPRLSDLCEYCIYKEICWKKND